MIADSFTDRFGSGRVRFIDTLRGMTMLLVVFHHIRVYSCKLGMHHVSPLADFFLSFRMPMFFFISGFISYKIVSRWDARFAGRRLVDKACVQLIPMFIFYYVFSLIGSFKWTYFPGGFWFTEALFEMFVVYFLAALLSHHTRSWVENVVLGAVAVALIAVFLSSPTPKFTYYIVFANVVFYFPFFVIGLMARKYSSVFFKIIESKWVVTALIIIALVLLIGEYKYRWSLNRYELGWMMLKYLKQLSLVVVIFTAFYKHRDFWNRTSWLSNSMEYVGRRTLDLYMLHYFILPIIPELGKFFAKTPNVVIEFFVIGALTIGVTVGSLLISNLLRTSPILARLLFGVKSPKKAVPTSDALTSSV